MGFLFVFAFVSLKSYECEYSTANIRTNTNISVIRVQPYLYSSISLYSKEELRICIQHEVDVAFGPAITSKERVYSQTSMGRRPTSIAAYADRVAMSCMADQERSQLDITESSPKAHPSDIVADI